MRDEFESDNARFLGLLQNHAQVQRGRVARRLELVKVLGSDPGSGDHRRGERVSWKGAKGRLAHAHGTPSAPYRATPFGEVEVAGPELLGCAIATGLGTDTRLPALGDGATWMADQVAGNRSAPSTLWGRGPG